jgi:hypothetical protein
LTVGPFQATYFNESSITDTRKSTGPLETQLCVWEKQIY